MLIPVILFRLCLRYCALRKIVCNDQETQTLLHMYKSEQYDVDLRFYELRLRIFLYAFLIRFFNGKSEVRFTRVESFRISH